VPTKTKRKVEHDGEKRKNQTQTRGASPPPTFYPYAKGNSGKKMASALEEVGT